MYRKLHSIESGHGVDDTLRCIQENIESGLRFRIERNNHLLEGYVKEDRFVVAPIKKDRRTIPVFEGKVIEATPSTSKIDLRIRPDLRAVFLTPAPLIAVGLIAMTFSERIEIGYILIPLYFLACGFTYILGRSVCPEDLMRLVLDELEDITGANQPD